MNRDFVEILCELSDAEADYLVVGAHALAAHGRPRATGDLDIWVRPTPKNAELVWKALRRFGAPLSELTQEDLATPEIVFQIGVVPCRIDILTSIDGVEFEEAWDARGNVQIEGLNVPILSREHLLTNKRATGRPKDQADAIWLESPEG